MYNKISLYLLISLLILYLQPSVDNTSHKGMALIYRLGNIYHNLNFSIEYPKNWTSTNHISPENVVVFTPNFTKGVGLGVFRHRLPTTTDYYQYDQSFNLNLYTALQKEYLMRHNFSITDVRNTSVLAFYPSFYQLFRSPSPFNGFHSASNEKLYRAPAIELECTSNNGTSLHMFQLWTIEDDIVYNIIYIGTQEKYNDYHQLAEDMIISFTLH